MSLNRYEQLLHDYIDSLPEERRFWQDRVLEIERGNSRREAAALALNAELWEYFEERSRHESEFTDVVSVGGGKLSMLNLSEYLLRMWGPVKPAKKAKPSV
ncbi:hypothetical protein [Pelagicoccus mobilis]|uniref:Uncharacterized protein n=1 Tax=Pelagicoccus mobilis TaxID=415221 RepID=A0A934VKQ5_9BACT|nr:hypothetical protein [Pelagicoccus mobilis]MBK1876936.1 hypothetical protein [Pelagicoccus mobilis]